MRRGGAEIGMQRRVFRALVFALATVLLETNQGHHHIGEVMWAFTRHPGVARGQRSELAIVEQPRRCDHACQ